MAGRSGSRDPLHRARFSAGERIRGELQRQAEGRLLDQGVFYTLLEVQVLTEQFRRTYNRIRPHSSLGYRPPAPETVQPVDLVPELVELT